VNLSTIGHNADRIGVPPHGLTGIDYSTAYFLTKRFIKNVYHILPAKQRKLAFQPGEMEQEDAPVRPADPGWAG
jgi:hypothetical protein